MNKIIKLTTLATVFAVLVGCGNDQQKSKEAAEDGNKIKDRIVHMNENELKNLNYFNPSTAEAEMNRTETTTLVEYKGFLEEYVKLTTRYIAIIDSGRVKGGISRETMSGLKDIRTDQLKTINNYLTKKGVLDQKGQVKPEFKAKPASPPPKEQQKPHKH